MVTTDPEPLIVAVELWFACRSCMLRSPLDAIEPNARAHCYRCGERQELPHEYYRAALHHAHGVAEIVARAEDDDGVVVPKEHAALGVTARLTEVPFDIGDGRGTDHLVRVGFSALRCPTCGSFSVRWEGRTGTLSITCDEHGTAKYEAPSAWGVYKHAAAVVTPAHRTDVRHAPARRDRRARASVCPTCAAPLVRGVGQAFAKCAFCATTSHVTPPRSLASDPPPVRMTILFVGESGSTRGLANLMK
jgi:hypothetical protein